MPNGTSSAVPAHLATLGQEATAGATRMLRAADGLHGALTTLARSDPPELAGWLLATMAGDVVVAGLRTMAWADEVLDVATAFAVAGAGTTLSSSVAGAVALDDRVVGDLLSLPGGRVRSVEELAAMGPARVRAWFQGLLALPGFEDPDFRAVEGLLYAVERGVGEAGVFSIFSDPAFDVADAAVLASMQDAWLRSRGITPPDPLPAGIGARAGAARADAVAGWVEWFETYGSLPEGERDALWARAEEGSVRAAEVLLAEQGTGFSPGMMTLVPFTHAFRAAVATHREGDLVRSLLATVDLQRLKERAGTVAGEWVAAAGRRAEAEARAEVERLHDRLPDILDPFLWPLDLQAATTAESAALAGAAIDTAVDVVPLSIAGLGPGDLLDRVGLGDDLGAVVGVLVDPSATPPDLVQRFLDDLIGEPAPYADPAGAYYLACLVDLGYLPGLSLAEPFIPGAVPSIPTS
ncbi:MAG: hypothetical protein H0W25_10480 [Acidimicrobiia bacterium]|nr:hypothetical protein [Acidimicrobiia bacterium]